MGPTMKQPFEKVVAHGAGWRDEPEFGPDRATLVALANA